MIFVGDFFWYFGCATWVIVGSLKAKAFLMLRCMLCCYAISWGRKPTHFSVVDAAYLHWYFSIWQMKQIGKLIGFEVKEKLRVFARGKSFQDPFP